MHLLVGVDGTEGSFRALSAAVDRVRETGEELSVALLVDAEGVASDELEERVGEVLGDHVDATVRHVSGNPASRLVELADGEEFDRLFVAGGNRSPLGKVNFDTFTEFVLLNANTSLVLIR